MISIRRSSDGRDGGTARGHCWCSVDHGVVLLSKIVLPICFLLSSYKLMVVLPTQHRTMLTTTDGSSYFDIPMATAKLAVAQSIPTPSQTPSSSSKAVDSNVDKKIEGTLSDIWTTINDDDKDEDDGNSSMMSSCPISALDGASQNDKLSQMTPFQSFCSTIGKQQFKDCQVLRTKTKAIQQRRDKMKQSTTKAAPMKTNSTSEVDNRINCNFERKESIPTEEERTTLWVTGMSLGFGEQGKDDNGGEYDWREDDKKNNNRFLDEYIAAIESWKTNAHDVFQPVLIIMTPPRTSSLAAPLSTSLPPFGKYVQEKYGVIVLLIHSLSFEDIVYSNHPSYRTTGEIGYYLRFDIPRIFQETHQLQLHQKLLERHESNLRRKEKLVQVPRKDTNCNHTSTTSTTIYEWYDLEKIFYTDSDILFVNPITNYEIHQLKSQVSSDPKEKFLMYGQDYLINRPKPSNTGVMVMDLLGFTRRWPKILEWGKAAAQRQELPEHDQLWLNRYYDSPKKWSPENVLLPPTWNWKVYWQIEVVSNKKNDVLDNFQQDDRKNTTNRALLRHFSSQIEESNPPISDIKLVHFHGPKPFVGLEELARCDYESGILGHPNHQQQQQHPVPPDKSNSTGSASSLSIVGVGTVKSTYQMFVSSGMCCDYGRTARAVLKLNKRWRPKKHYWIDDKYILN